MTLHRHLTVHDRDYRFFTLQPVQLDELVGKLTVPFHADRLIGVANYTVVCDEPREAEIAIVVEIPPQGVRTGQYHNKIRITALLGQLPTSLSRRSIGMVESKARIASEAVSATTPSRPKIDASW
jgi:hypothetical protein